MVIDVNANWFKNFSIVKALSMKIYGSDPDTLVFLKFMIWLGISTVIVLSYPWLVGGYSEVFNAIILTGFWTMGFTYGANSYYDKVQEEKAPKNDN